MNKMSMRGLKAQILDILRDRDFSGRLPELRRHPARQVVNPLFSLLYHGDDLIRWRAVTAMGTVVAGLADRDLESARVIVRRLIWNLNDESGGIGWGSPEAMGEILSRHRRLAEEYARILIAFVDPQGNFLEHEELQAGALWGIARLSHEHPDLARPVAGLLIPFLSSPRAALRGLAAWAAPRPLDERLAARIESLLSDPGRFNFFWKDVPAQVAVGDLARAALQSRKPPKT